MSLGREPSLETIRSTLKKYWEHAPGFARAIAAFLDAEARIDDPLEGNPNSQLTTDAPRSRTLETETVGPMGSLQPLV
jgi:hypothetical protein